MPNNRRIFYAIKSIGFSPYGGTTYIEAHAVQSAGVTTTFNLEHVLELGQISVYANIELVPEIEFTAEKCLDGYPLLMHLATKGSSDPSLVGRSNVRTTIAMNIFGDSQQSASGVSIAEVILSGMYWSATNFNFPVEGSFRETFSAVGNNKQWRDTGGGTAMLFSGFFLNNDSPLAQTSGSGGIQRREHMIFYPIGQGNSALETATTLDANSQLVAFLTVLPPDIPGISTSGTNDRDSAGNFNCHVQEITTGVSLGRDALYEQGRKGPYFRFVNFPIEVTTTIAITATKWDNVSALENGINTSGPYLGENVSNRSIRIRVREGTYIDVGTKNKLTNVSFTGGDTDGGNVVSSYTYQTWSDFYVSHPRDPSMGGNIVWPY